MLRFVLNQRFFAALLLIVTVAVCTSCLKDHDGVDASGQSTLVITEQGGTKGDISNVVLYVFDQNQNFIDTMATKLDTPIDFVKNYRNYSKITVVAFGNTHGGNLTFPTFKKGDAMSKALVKLNMANAYAVSPDDLFMGAITIDLTANTEQGKTYYDEISRRVSSMTIVARNLKQWYGTADNDFYFVVRSTYDSMDFTGNFTGTAVSYKPTVVCEKNTDFFSDIFNTYPNSSAQYVTVDIYKGTTLVYSASKDSSGKPYQLIPNTTLSVIIDFGATIDVNFIMAPWGTSEIHEIFN